MSRNKFPEEPEPQRSEAVDTFIQKIALDEAYRPHITKLVTAKQWFRERLVKTGRFTFLQRDHWRVLEVLIENINLDHWKVSGGEMFAFPERRAIEEIGRLGFKNARRNLEALEQFGLIKPAVRLARSGWLLIFPEECDSEEWLKHCDKRGNARRQKSLTDHPTLFPEPESPATPEGVTGDSGEDRQAKSRVTPLGVIGDSAPESRVTPEHNKERARAASTLSDSSSSTPRSAAAAASEKEREKIQDQLAAGRVLKDLRIGRSKIRELLALPTSDYRTVRAAQIEAAKSHVPNKTGLVISLVKHPERISEWALEEVDRRAAQAARMQQHIPAAPVLNPQAEAERLARCKAGAAALRAAHANTVLTPEAKALLASTPAGKAILAATQNSTGGAGHD